MSRFESGWGFLKLYSATRKRALSNERIFDARSADPARDLTSSERHFARGIARFSIRLNM